MTTEIIPVGTFRKYVRIVTCKRSTGHEGDTYRTFIYWNAKDASSKHPKPTPGTNIAWTLKRSLHTAVWDGKVWREIGAAVKPK